MIADTIKNLRRKNFLSQTAFAKKIGVTQGSVSQWENGLTSPNSEQLRSIASMFNISIDELLDSPGQVQMIRAAVPIRGTVACGERRIPDTETEGTVDLPDGVKADFALICRGDSMEPTFLDGDFVLIRSQSTVENGQIAAVNIDGETTLKHIYYQETGITLTADNAAYPPVFVPFEAGEEIIIHGLAVGYTRIF